MTLKLLLYSEMKNVLACECVPTGAERQECIGPFWVDFNKYGKAGRHTLALHLLD